MSWHHILCNTFPGSCFISNFDMHKTRNKKHESSINLRHGQKKIRKGEIENLASISRLIYCVWRWISQGSTVSVIVYAIGSLSRIRTTGPVTRWTQIVNGNRVVLLCYSSWTLRVGSSIGCCVRISCCTIEYGLVGVVEWTRKSCTGTGL